MWHKSDYLHKAYYLNILVIILELCGLGVSVYSMGTSMFCYYTEDSNIVNLISSICFVYYFHKHHDINDHLMTLRFMGVSTVMLTFIVVMVILAPWVGIGMHNLALGYFYMLGSGGMPFTHLLCPLISFISFVLYERKAINKKLIIYAGLPTLLYALISTTCNILKLWYGPYPFLYVYEQPVYMSVMWFVLIVGMGYLMAFIIYELHLKHSK